MLVCIATTKSVRIGNNFEHVESKCHSESKIGWPNSSIVGDRSVLTIQSRMAQLLHRSERVKARAERAAESNKIKWENFQVRRICWISTFLQPLEVAPHWSLHCGKIGHRTRDYRGKTIATSANTQPIVTCYDHGERGHIKSQCPKRNNQQAGNARGRAYVMKDGRQQGPNVVTGTFLLNNCYAIVLFDSGSDKRFVFASFSTLIDISLVKLDTSYDVELADGKIVSTNDF
ncbi:hypothetical protein Tco_0327841 [Tanacetum coccineum]